MLGNRIKELRLQKGITQEQLAQHLNVAKSTIGMWENEKREPDVSTLIKLSNYFHCSIDQLVNDKIRLKSKFHESQPEHLCPICGYDCIHFLQTINIKYDNEKSFGIALRFLCEEEHIFYIVIEDYKGNSYLTYTDKDFNIIKAVNEDALILNSPTGEKYRSLDEYGKKAVDDLLNTEYERCEDYNKDNVINIQAAYSQVSAGTGEWLESSDFDVISVKATPEAYKADIAIPVKGDSMLPLYSSGDYVLVRRQPDIDIGEIGIFILDNNAYIKKRGEHELISINPEYDNVTGNEFSDYRCFGKVLGKAEILE